MREEFADLGVTFRGADDDKADEEEGEVVPVWDISWDSMMAFLDCSTQWRAAVGMSGLVWLGLDYAGVATLLAAREAAPGVFDDIRVMEREALKAFDEIAAEDAG